MLARLWAALDHELVGRRRLQYLRPMRDVVIVGAGEIGGALAHILARAGLASSITLVDETGDVAAGKALDIMQAAPIEGFATTVAGHRDLAMSSAGDVTILADRDRSGPDGAFGGEDGRKAEYLLIRGGVETRLGSKTTFDLEPGDVVSCRTCGGGGYGPPAERDPELVARDVREGTVSAERARDVYRVAVVNGAVDESATSELRRSA